MIKSLVILPTGGFVQLKSALQARSCMSSLSSTAICWGNNGVTGGFAALGVVLHYSTTCTVFSDH
jgi:hypothetical protein